jgi:predicted dehydrogenase
MARRPTEIPIERRVRVGILGLGQVYDLCITGYQSNPDAEIVALCDVEPGRVDERAGDWSNAERFVDIEDFLQADMDLVRSSSRPRCTVMSPVPFSRLDIT